MLDLLATTGLGSSLLLGIVAAYVITLALGKDKQQ